MPQCLAAKPALALCLVHCQHRRLGPLADVIVIINNRRAPAHRARWSIVLQPGAQGHEFAIIGLPQGGGSSEVSSTDAAAGEYGAKHRGQQCGASQLGQQRTMQGTLPLRAHVRGPPSMPQKVQ